MKATVYFSRQITPEKVVVMYRALGVDLPGKVAVKVSFRREGQSKLFAAEVLAAYGGSGARHSCRD